MQEGPFSDSELRRALMMMASNDRSVDVRLAKELTARGYIVGESGSARLTPLGAEFLEAPPSAEVRSSLLETMKLTRVIGSAAEGLTRTGSRVVVTAAELWTTETVIRWTIIGDGPPKITRRPETVFRRSSLEDDVGTTYQSIQSGGGGDRYITHRYDRFSGVVPEHASALRFTPRDESTTAVTPDAIDTIHAIAIALP